MPGLTGSIYPKGVGDTYPMVEDIHLKGSHQTVANITERDAIYTERRKEGLTCYVASEGVTYQLQGGITNTHWVSVVHLDNFSATRAPLGTDDETQGYSKGSLWFVGVSDPHGFGAPLNRGIWHCANPATGKAQWHPIHLPHTARKTCFARYYGAIYQFDTIKAAIDAGFDTIFAAGFHDVGLYGDGPIHRTGNLTIYGFPQLGCYLYDSYNPVNTPIIKVTNGRCYIQDVTFYSSWASDNYLIELNNVNFFYYNNRLGNPNFSRDGGVEHIPYGSLKPTIKCNTVQEVYIRGILFKNRVDYVLDSDASYNKIEDCEFWSYDNNTSLMKVQGNTDFVNCVVRAPYNTFKTLVKVVAPCNVNIRDINCTGLNDTGIDIDSNDCVVNISGLNISDLTRNNDILVRTGKTGNTITLRDSTVGLISIPAGNVITGQYNDNKIGGEVLKSIGPIGRDIQAFNPTAVSPTLTLVEGDRYHTIIVDTTTNAGTINLPPINIVGPPLQNSDTREVRIRFQAGANPLVIAPNGADNINGVPGPLVPALTVGTSITLIADATTLSWYGV